MTAGCARTPLINAPMFKRLSLPGLSLALALLCGTASAQTLLDEWATVSAPAAPALKAATPDPRTTALLMLDFQSANCGRRPRCVASVPKVKVLLEQARAKGMAVIHAIIPNSTTADILPQVAPLAGEPFVQSGANKFIRTDLEKLLTARGIKTIIVVGTAAHGAVLNTGAHAALLGMDVIVPIDGMSSDSAYPEQYVTWHFANGPGLGPRSTITRLDMIKF